MHHNTFYAFLRKAHKQYKESNKKVFISNTINTDIDDIVKSYRKARKDHIEKYNLQIPMIPKVSHMSKAFNKSDQQDILNAAFAWRLTTEGHEFWRRIYDLLTESL